MRIKKLIRAFGIIFLIALTIYMLVSNSKYVWKGFGYTFCEGIDNIQIYSVTKEHNKQYVNIKGKSKEFSGYYTGYSFHIEEGTLYVGIKYNKLWGYENKVIDFNIQIPCKIKDIKNIYLIDGASIRKIL